MRAAIVGCGLIGQKRARALAGCDLAVCCDVLLERAEALSRQYPAAISTSDWKAAVQRDDVDLVIVATSHDMLADIATTAALSGKHVLIEKPGARRACELDPVLAAQRLTGVCIRVGFNHRYHRAIQKAREIFVSGGLGEPMFLRARYGHGGRPGYDKEWRAQPEISGGGEAIDQGMHLIDLARWFLGDFTKIQGYAGTFFWEMPVDDNAFLLLRTAQNRVAFLHATWTEWKNLFSLEIYGRTGKLDIFGLGGSYGVERVAYYKMLPEMGPPETTIFEYPMSDDSWNREMAEFLDDISLNRTSCPGVEDAQAALRIVEQVYRESRS